ncbi:hypothetical protein MMC10_004985 [Thelotrema lepadinum]|nr:hypothetical protein [Thelotrema lepadinum]
MDPGTALGVVSLGITVCQGLLDYYKSWQAYRDDIKSTSACVEHLLQLLYQIKELLDSKKEDGLQGKLMRRVDRIAQNCTSNLRALEEQLRKTKPFDNAQTIRDKLHNKLRKLDYPFQKETLEGLNKEVAKSRTNLLEVLNVLQVQQNNEIEGLVERIHRSQVKAEVKSWLAAPDPSVNQNVNLEQRHADTGLWFLSSTDYEEWKTQDDSSIWLQGFAGAGKSVLCSAVVQDLQQLSTADDNISMSYFYLTFTDDVKTKVSGLLKSILLQLSVSCPASPSPLDSLCATYKGATPPDADLLNAIRKTTASFSEVFLVVDALDECSERQKLIKTLNYIRSWRTPNLHLLVTSRVEPDLVEGLSWPEDKVVSIQTAGLDGDIEIYVESLLAEDKSFQRWASLHDDIRSAILS